MATTVTLKPNAIDLSGSTSGTTTLQATAVAGTTTITLPAATDTLVGKATTDTLTNKTLTTPTISSLSSASATALTLQSAGTTAITVDTSQNVGIGTSSPSVKLDVAGTVRFGATSSNRILYLGQSSPADNGAGSLEFQVSNTVKNWAIRTNNNVAGALEFCPSTTAGGTTYTTPSMIVDSAGRVLVGLTSANTSGANFQVSSGVTFPATQSASSDANTLDDYEEGTFTPVLIQNGGGGTFNYSSQVGSYTKIGNTVFVSFTIALSSVSGMNGDFIYITLPFNIGTMRRQPITLTSATGVSSSYNAQANDNVSSFYISYSSNLTSAQLDFLSTYLTTSTRLSGTLTYIV